ncbi:MAG: UPF0149 family protein [Ideonella sp.]
MSKPTSVIPSTSSATAMRDLSDAEFAALDDLLAATPPPLEPLDVVMLDGFLCGLLVQPVLIETAQWLPAVFDLDGRPLPDDHDPAWLARTTELIVRRQAALNRDMIEDGWFDPLVLEPDDASMAPDNVPSEQEPTDEADPLAELSPASKALMPWVAGFQYATECFPALLDLPDDAVSLAVARLFRHLPTESDEERQVVATLDREFPLNNLEDAIEELVVTVADLADLTRDARYHVDQFQREGPKLGRNDPCHCGSGKKFKQCHGK